MTPLGKIQEMNDLVQDINQVLSLHGIQETITLSDITITDKTVSDLVKSNPFLSDVITNHLWPSTSSATVYHYTSKAVAESILNTGIFRLNNIANRYDEGETVTFCETHSLQGYLEQDENGDPKYKSLLMPNTFYASFTDTSLTEEQEEYFWEHFATCDGVRLKIEIKASNHNFRKLHYEQVEGEPIKLLAELTECVRNKYNREFVLKGISRLCSFYLSGKDYANENEFRLMHRVWEGSEPQPKDDGSHSYIELPIGGMSKCGYQLKIVEVHSIEQPTMPNSYIYSKRNA